LRGSLGGEFAIGQERIVASFLEGTSLGGSVGRPRGSGTIFRDDDDFLDRVSDVVERHRRNNGHDPTQAELASHFGVSVKTIQRATRAAGYASWEHLLAGI
jgi:hypothetical protein